MTAQLKAQRIDRTSENVSPRERVQNLSAQCHALAVQSRKVDRLKRWMLREADTLKRLLDEARHD